MSVKLTSYNGQKSLPTSTWVSFMETSSAFSGLLFLFLAGVLVKCHNFINCTNLNVLTRTEHPHGLVIVDFNVSIGLICHNYIDDT